MRAAREPWANHIIKNRKCQRGAGAEDSFLGHAKHDLKSFRTAIELRGEKFLAIQQVENSVDDAKGAAETVSRIKAAGGKSEAMAVDAARNRQVEDQRT